MAVTSSRRDQMTAISSYRDQYDRVKRWYARFAAIDQGRQHDVPSDNYLDEIYAFFLNCYHLKDWIIHDSRTGATAQQIEDFIDTHRPLRLCADICNSLKHLRLTRPERSGESPAFGRKQFALHLGSGPTTISLKYEIDTSTGPTDAFQLATECIDA